MAKKSDGDAQRESPASPVMELRKQMAQELRDAAKEFDEENVVDWAIRQALERVAEAFEVGVRRG